MKYAIVYASKTGNTRLLAETIRSLLPAQDLIYFGEPSREALSAQRIYAGFWTDKGTCDSASAEFLKTLTDQQVFLFGTAGFGGDPSYFEKILGKVGKHLASGVAPVGSYMCQGKMPMSVRDRYEKMQKSPVPVPNLKAMIENFDRALSHPDGEDLEGLKQAVRETL